MTLEIRPYREEEAAAFFRVPAIVFGNYAGEAAVAAESERSWAMRPDWTLCAFEDGELATTYGAFPFGMRLNGAKMSVAGVSFVGSLPQFRRRGHLRKIMETDFRRRHEEGLEPLAILLASVAAIYQRYGYAVTAHAVRYSIDPRWINIAPSIPPATGRWREAKPDELPLLMQLYRDFIAPRNGMLHRGQYMWNVQALGIGGMPGDNPFGPALVHVYEEHGQPRGYVTWSAKWLPSSPTDTVGPGQRIQVRDYAYLTPGALRAVWEFFRSFDLAVNVSIDNAPVDDPAMHIMLDPRELNARARDHVLSRIIDLDRTLPQRPYGAEGRFVLQVRDAMCPWNDGTWSLETSAEGARVSASTQAPDISLDISALAQLLFGTLSPTNAVRAGRAEASDHRRLPALDAAFRTEYAPWCPNMF
ncbi:MAG: GNAT family N-acetyltransferase [Chloroflexi bacterium]|nr:GNAT family N-acetyltransferase [Chloroflexota bacterium]